MSKPIARLADVRAWKRASGTEPGGAVPRATGVALKEKPILCVLVACDFGGGERAHPRARPVS